MGRLAPLAAVTYESEALGAVLLPGAVSAAGVLVLSLLARRVGARALLGPAAALVLVFAFGVGALRLVPWPSLPLAPGEDAWRWTLWFAPLGWLAGVVEARRLPFALRGLLRALAGGAAAWLVVAPHRGLSPGLEAVHVAAGALLASALWTALRPVTGRRPGLAAAVPLALAIGATAAAYARFAGSFVLGGVAGALAGATLGATLAGARGPLAREVLPAAAAPVSLVFTGLLVSGHAYLNHPGETSFPLAAAVLLALAAVGGVLLVRTGRAGGLLGTAGALVLSGVAVWIVARIAPPAWID